MSVTRMIRGAARLWFAALALSALSARADVILQWFETDWDEMYRRMPEAAEIGYDYLWVPPPTKAPTGQGTHWGNVGYNLYDRFDLGDVPQRGSLATRYGTRGALRNMVDAAHACDVKIIPDIVMNHNGNGPDFRSYPGMKPEDFHVQWQEGYLNSLNYKRGPRMGYWSPDGGYGGTLWQELVSLIDIRTEDGPLNGDPSRFTGGNHTPGWNFVAGASYLRHPGQYERYPYYPSGYGAERASELLYRWIAWLGNAIDYDGLRLDAAKHVDWEFFGTRGQGFLHEAQWSYNQRRGYSDGNSAEADELFANDLAERDDALIFAEILSPWSEIEYWFGGGARNPMRFLDYAIKKTADSALRGNIGNFYGYGNDFGPNNGVMYIWGHDEGPADKVDLGYAYILTHVGLPMVYFTGSNIAWSDYKTRTWMVPGYDAKALADQGNELANLVWIHHQFARGSENSLWHDGDYLAYERIDDAATANRAVLLVALNDSGRDLGHDLYTSFAEGTVLHDYTGHFLEDWGDGAGNVRVGAGGKVHAKVPGNNGQGWVCFAPLIPEAMAIDILQGCSPAPTMSWIVPGGVHAADKPRRVTRITSANFRVNARFGAPAAGVDSCMVKWGRGLPLGGNAYDSGRGVVSGGYERMDAAGATNWTLDVTMTDTNIPEGLNIVKCRAFVARSAGEPALFNTVTEVVYVDRRGPEVDIVSPAEGESVRGDAVMRLENAGYTAYGMTVAIDGGPAAAADEVMKGLWRFALTGLSSGVHTALVTTTEADWGEPRAVINTSLVERVFSVLPPVASIGVTVAGGADPVELPFFTVSVSAAGAPDDVRLYWDGYRLPFNAGALTHTFNGDIVYDRDPANVTTDRLWGAFCNGPHVFEAVRIDGGVTSRAVARAVFDLYGIGAIDSDGDGLPDNVEMPYIDSQGAPGADAPWPGDSNYDFIPNSDEHWTRLNPYNHSTYYSGQWDDQLDSDGDGYANGDELRAGYAQGNIYAYNIYDASSVPAGTPTRKSAAAWSPRFAVPGELLHVVYSPNQGPLEAAARVVLHVGHSKRSEGEWQDVVDVDMAVVGTNRVYDYAVPANATSVDFVFHDGAGTWDNNSGNDWQVTVVSATNTAFAIDGVADSDAYTAHGDTMKILAAVNGDTLYVATWGVAESAGGNDHFIFVTDELGDAHAAPWRKAGAVFFDTTSKPYLAAEGTSGWQAWFNVAGASANGVGGVLEGAFNLRDAFGKIPDAIYIAAVSYGTNDGDGPNSQGPYTWNGDDTIDIMEFQRIPLASVRDEDLDGYFDAGRPRMWTVVGNSTNDANYGLRRFFLNEPAGETREMTVVLEPNVGVGNTVSDVELFSNLNRRDYAVLPGEEDWATVTTNSASTYYRAYAMASAGAGRYVCTISVRKCGAYRINARYRVNGGPYVYYTDNGLRRDCAVVVSPRKALDTTLYELNPLVAEATDDTFSGRSTFADMVSGAGDPADPINTNTLAALGINMIWLQPIHPIGSEGRQVDPDTGQPYTPGSPYAVRNYWKVNAALGNPATDAEAMLEFTNFVQTLDRAGIGVMLDGTFNHSAWDCEVGQAGVDLFGWATNAERLIRDVRPEWYSRKDDYGAHATTYQNASTHDIATAPDRIDFGKWPDAADFYYGVYDCLVRQPPADTNNAWASAWYKRFLLEEDRFEGFADEATRELWRYFAEYPLYWLEKTGHPAGTPREESWRGIDGLRCDFAQGLPSAFWEYCINRTRSVKWDFLFMAESLDGYSEVNGSYRHGVGYRSSRHFDILNENIVFYWRNEFFAYPYQGAGGDNWGKTPQPYTDPIRQAFDRRRQAYDASPLLLNLSSHDEVYPSHDPYRLLYAHAVNAAMDGVPMLLYGQEAGAQNDSATYNFSGEIPDAAHNFDRYELNFGKSIVNFKRYNSMRNVWANRDLDLQAAYGRINRAREASPALRSQNVYVLSRTGDPGGYDPDIFAVAKYEAPGANAASQDVVFAFVNNNYWGSTNRWATFDVSASVDAGSRFGIQPAGSYNLVDLMSDTPDTYVWGAPRSGADIRSNGITVGLTGDPLAGRQAQYLRLVDVAVGPHRPDLDGDGVADYSDWDDDGDGLPDAWEQDHGLDPRDAAGLNGHDGDKDGDGMSNWHEYLAGTDPDDAGSVLRLTIRIEDGAVELGWSSVPERDYELVGAPTLPVAAWERRYAGTAGGETQRVVEAVTPGEAARVYGVRVRP